MTSYSVLMSVYKKEKPDNLRLSMESIFAQTVPTDDFVLICDGPLTDELDAVIDEMFLNHPEVLNVVRFDTNRGLHFALNDGLKICKNELVARIDSDDFSLPDRMEKSLKAFEGDPELVILGGAVKEFEGSADNIVSSKVMPLSHEEVLKYSKRRCPFNHPTVMYKRSELLKLGGYPDFPCHEDYAMWVALLSNGKKSLNLADTLTLMRTDEGLYERRGGFSYLKTALKFRYQMYRSNFSGLFDFLYVGAVMTVSCLIPTSFRKFVYKTLLRNKEETKNA